MYVALCVSGLILLITSCIILFRRKKYTYPALYAEAVKNENNGHFKEALENYITVLAEIKKYRFNEKMEQQLIEKIKVLRSAIEYESH